ncbi:ribosome-associated protein L7Ae-like protein [Clostridium acetireducens DSM 10703]|jgi:large subunit ribosomal protein L7A|uniref:Ribosome-associated protein L7Ae-like protein n=1 Tax=Clostridium acetireducens DSM 10703 TaxID=1121290 RepID=A0A1E8F0F9_9CLOT|nr:ribosomal L7Ae/L30e/S12e/Gadd45 family protein [Clostridium acetireducens]OFI06899.1 ribosome-associated protein L7Ae-like protein [Clostridium acetireducens DSM 10703]
MVDRLTGKKVIGLKQTLKFMKNRKGIKIYIAKDADENLINRLEEVARDNSVDIEYVETMKKLGKLCGINVGAATALILKE